MDTLELLYWISYILGAALAAVCAALSFHRALKSKGTSLFYHLLTGFYACIFMSCLFYLLTWLVADYPYVISPGDLSWGGAIVFLITAALEHMDKWTPEQREAAKKYRLPALAAPAVCAAFNAVYVSIYPEILLNYLLYGIPTAILAYYALLIYLSGKKAGVQPGLLPYYLTVLAWIGSQLIFDLFSTLGWDYGYAVHATVCIWIMTLLTTGVYVAARKGAGA